jgi:hypothetical protein
MTRSYSLRDVVPDGLLAGPRWELHLVKLTTSMAVAFGLIAIGVPPLAAGIAGSLGVMLLIIVRQRAHVRTFPLWSFLVDKLNDTAIACVALACALRLAFGWWPALVVLAVSIAVWAVTHRRAVP